MATKRPTKKRSTKKKVSTSTRRRSGNRAASPGLPEFLENEIRSTLLDYQASGGTRKVREDLIDILNPDESEVFVILNRASARMIAVHQKLKEARVNHEIRGWILPSVAAAWFESLFHSCVLVWMVAGDPDTSSELRPSVSDYIHTSVKSYSAVIGA